jgi:hypothetical protein
VDTVVVVSVQLQAGEGSPTVDTVVVFFDKVTVVVVSVQLQAVAYRS